MSPSLARDIPGIKLLYTFLSKATYAGMKPEGGARLACP